MDKLLRESVRANIILVLVSALILIIAARPYWAIGIMLGAVWSTLNLLLTIKLLKIAILKESKSNLFAFLLLKFPLLYIIGALILVSRLFPAGSLLLGLSSIFLAMGALKLCPSRLCLSR